MDRSKANILLVDDDVSTGQTYRRILVLEGYNVTVATCGGEGLTLLRAAHFDLNLTDYRMPDVTGLELLAEATALGINTPIVMYTACGSHALKEAAFRLGAADFEDSLFDTESLLDVVRRRTADRLLAKLSARNTDRPIAIGPAHSRWIKAMLAVTECENDVPTLQSWSRLGGNSVSTLKKICSICGVRAGVVLDFARALRIAQRHSRTCCDWYNVLDIKEPSTMATFLAKAGFLHRTNVPDVAEFLKTQSFIRSQELIAIVEQSGSFDR